MKFFSEGRDMGHLFRAAVIVLSMAALPASAQHGGFAGGLSNGLQQGMRLNMQRQYLESQQSNTPEDPEEKAWREQILETSSEQKSEDKSLSSRQKIARAMVETDLLDNPGKLQALAVAAAAYGVADEMPPFSELAQKAKRRAEIKTFQSLMLGNIDASIDAAKLSGSPFADRPVKIKPNDPDDFTWRIQQEGGVETAVNVKTMFELYSKMAQSENASVTRETLIPNDRNVSEGDRKERQIFMEEQRAFMRNQDMRNGLQILQMLGPQSGQGVAISATNSDIIRFRPTCSYLYPLSDLFRSTCLT